MRLASFSIRIPDELHAKLRIMAAFKNDSNIPLSIAVFLAAQTYDFKPNNRSLSATDFNRSIRQVILRNRMNVAESNDNEPKDIASLVKSKNGTAIHDAI